MPSALFMMMASVQAMAVGSSSMSSASSSSSSSAAGSSCLAGYYDPAGGSNCVGADYGYYVPTSGATVAYPAPVGAYVDKQHQSAYTDCPKGTYSDVMGSTKCFDAPKGYFVGLTGAVVAQPCASGSYSDVFGASVCQDAPIGSYAVGLHQTQATVCPDGEFTSAVGSTACSFAPAGSYAVGDGIKRDCARGSYNDTIHQSACTLAPKGSYVPLTAQTMAQNCPIGKYTSTLGASECSLAPVGSYVDTLGAQAPTACPPGYYTGSMGLSTCGVAPLGSYASGDGILHSCPTGSYSDMLGAASCSLAPAGSFVSVVGATTSSQCTAGTYSNTLGSTDCSDAPAGRYVALPGQTTALNCPLGKYTAASGQTQCDSAPLGSYVSSLGATEATQCPVGSFANTMGSSGCTLAPAGSYVAQLGQTTAIQCPVGKYTASAGASRCDLAPAGSFVDALGATAATECALGRFTSAWGSGSCTLAPIGSYVPTVGATAALACPVGTFSRELGASECVTATYGEINFSAATYSVDENSDHLTITVNRTGGTDDQINVDYWLRDGTATATTDYSYTAGTLTFANGEAAKTFDVSPVDNAIFNVNKTFSVLLGHATHGAELGSVNAAEVTIANDDTPPEAGAIGVEFSSLSTQENQGTLNVSLLRSGGSSGAATVNYSTQDGNGVASKDYVAANGTVHFAAGETSQSLSLMLLNNTTYDGTRDFQLRLSNPQGGALLANALTDIHIADDETQPATGAFEFSAAAYRVNENAGTADLTVSRVGGTQGAATVDIAAAESTTALGDTTKTLSFAEGESSKTLQVTLTDDSEYTGDQEATLVLSNAVGAVLGHQKRAQVTVVDDEAPPTAGVLQLSGDDYTLVENTSLTVTVTRAFGSVGEVSVDLATADGTAKAGTDYQTITTTLTFAENELSKTVTVPIIDNSQYTGARTFSLALANATGGAMVGSVASATATILEDDSPPAAGLLQWSGASYSVSETDKKVTLTVNRTDGSFGSASVDYAFSNGTATRGTDFTATDGTLYFSDGETSKTLIVDVVDDQTVEKAENFSVVLSNAAGAALGTTASTQVSITDNDVDVVVETPKKSSGGGGLVSWWLLLVGALGFGVLRRRK